MNYIDIILCVPLVWGLYKGFTKGLIIEAASLVAFGLGIWGGVHFSELTAAKVSKWLNWQSDYLPILSFAIIFLLIVIVVYFIAKLVQRSVDGMALSAFNKAGGAAFGSLKFALILSVIIFILDAVEKSYPVISIKAKEEALLYRPMGKIAPLLIPALKDSKIGELIPKQEDVGVDVKIELKNKKEE